MSSLQLWSELFDNSTVNIIKLNDGEFWFQVSHVCKLLGHTNPTVALQSHTDEDERQQLDIGKHELVNFVSESGLYGLILGSNKPEAKKFKRWLRREVLPKLRASGGYIMPSATSEQLEALQGEIAILKEQNAIALDRHQRLKLVEAFFGHCLIFKPGQRGTANAKNNGRGYNYVELNVAHHRFNLWNDTGIKIDKPEFGRLLDEILKSSPLPPTKRIAISAGNCCSDLENCQLRPKDECLSRHRKSLKGLGDIW
jgi:prophage antirepressor-like protein